MAAKTRWLPCYGERADGRDTPCLNSARKGAMTCGAHAAQEEALEQEIRTFFVYGTLKTGYGNHRLMLGHVEHAEPATVDGYTLYGNGIPYARPAASEYVSGEVIKIKEASWESCLSRIDGLEGHPRHYLRTLVAAVRRDGTVVPAWMYVGPDRCEEWGEPLGSAWPKVRTEPAPPEPGEADETALEVAGEVEADVEIEEVVGEDGEFEDEYTEEDALGPGEDAIDVQALAERWGCKAEDIEDLSPSDLEDLQNLADDEGL